MNHQTVPQWLHSERIPNVIWYVLFVKSILFHFYLFNIAFFWWLGNHSLCTLLLKSCNLLCFCFSSPIWLFWGPARNDIGQKKSFEQFYVIEIFCNFIHRHLANIKDAKQIIQNNTLVQQDIHQIHLKCISVGCCFKQMLTMCVGKIMTEQYNIKPVIR